MEDEIYQKPTENSQQIATTVAAIKKEISKVIIGQDETVTLLLASLFTEEYVLLESVPGIAKTLLSRMLSKTLDTGFSRIQFTPDLMPTDITGTTILNMSTSEFTFKKGPVFSNIVLINEINRSPAKTQAALFEVMEERQLTYDGTTYPIAPPFFIMKTSKAIALMNGRDFVTPDDIRLYRIQY